MTQCPFSFIITRSIEMVKNTKGGSSHKKMARKNEDDYKEIKINLDVDFKLYNMVVLIDKNLGNCFTAEILHFLGDSKKYPSQVKILHQRGKTAKKVFDRTQSRIALVSLVTDFKLEGGCIGYVEELLLIDHLNAYLSNKLIDSDVFNLLNKKMNSRVEDKEDKEKDDGFDFDRGDSIPNNSNTMITENVEYINGTNTVASRDSPQKGDSEINIDDI